MSKKNRPFWTWTQKGGRTWQRIRQFLYVMNVDMNQENG